MREAKRQKEKDAFLQAEKKKSRATEQAFFKTEKNTAKSLNSFLMQNSASSGVRSQGLGGDSDDGHCSGPRIEFAEVYFFFILFYIRFSVSKPSYFF